LKLIMEGRNENKYNVWVCTFGRGRVKEGDEGD
jgi:hypothetical protein